LFSELCGLINMNKNSFVASPCRFYCFSGFGPSINGYLTDNGTYVEDTDSTIVSLYSLYRHGSKIWSSLRVELIL